MSVTLQAVAARASQTPTQQTSSPEATAETLLPPNCFVHCNDAYVEVQAVGRNPEICDPTSAFQESYSECINCINLNATDLKKSSMAYLEPKFRQVLEFCSGQAPTSTIQTVSYNTGVPASMLTTITHSQLMDLEGLDGKTVSGVLRLTTITVKKGEVQSTQVATSQIALDTSAASLQSVAPESPQNNYASIIGPIVGVIGLALLLGGVWLLLRRKKLRATRSEVPQSEEEEKKYEKPELQADCVAKAPPIEMEGSYPEPVPEMGANEVPAQEMSVSTTVAEMPERHT